MFSKGHVGGRLGAITVLALLLGWAGARPAHADITSVTVDKVAHISGSVVFITGTITTDAANFVIIVALEENLPRGFTAVGNGSVVGPGVPNTPQSWVVRVSASNITWQPGNARFVLRANDSSGDVLDLGRGVKLIIP